MKNKIKLVFMIILSLSLFALVGCNTTNNTGNEPAANNGVTEETTDEAAVETNETTAENTETGETPTIDAIKSRGKLVLATSADYPPYEWHLMKDGQDEIVGFDIAIGQEIADSLGVELEVIDMNFDGILPSLSSGDSDIAIAGLVPNEERKKEVDFTDIYYLTTQVMLVRSEDAQALSTIEAYDGKTIGAQLGATQETLARETFPNAEVFPLAKLNDLVLELQNKSIDSILMVEPAAKQYADVNENLQVLDVGLPDHDGSAIAIAKGNEDFLQYTNDLLKKLMDEGKVDAYVEEYTKLAEEEANAQ